MGMLLNNDPLQVNFISDSVQRSTSSGKKVCQTSGTDATGVAVACGNERFKKMWQANRSAKLVPKNRGKLVAVAD